MNVISALTYKRMSSLTTGEIIMKRMGGGMALAIVLGSAPLKTFLGVLRLEGSDRDQPFHVAFQTEGRCISFGTDCIFELGNFDALDDGANRFSPGAISLGEEGEVILMFAPYDSFSSTETGFDLKTNEFVDPPSQYSLTLTKWRIWANEADRTSTKAVPIFEFQLPA